MHLHLADPALAFPRGVKATRLGSLVGHHVRKEMLYLSGLCYMKKRSCINQQLTLIQFKKSAAQNDIAKTELGVDPQYSPGAYLQRQQ